jgi:phosphate starvation-inducible membrane PsiE
VRPSLLYFPFVALVFFYLHCGPKRGLVYFAGLLTGFMLLASPWYVRNLITLNKLSDSHLKITFLHHGLYPDFTYNGNRKSFGYPYAFDPRSDEIDQNTRTVLTEIANRFQNRPLEHIYWYVFKKPVALWSWNMVQGSEDVFIYPVSKTPYKDDSLFRLTHRLAHLLHWPIVVLAITGFWVVWFAGLPYGDIQPKMMLARFIATLLIYFTFLHMIGVPFPRYSVPLRPLLYAMAMFTLSYGIDRIRIRFWPLTENTAVQEALSESMHEVL